MALIVADRVQETSTTTGTGSLTLGGAVTGFQAFSSVLSTGDTTYYTIADQGGANWEVGLGTFTSPSTLARTTILSSSNAGSAVNFTAGTKSVFITYPASRSVLSNSSGVVTVPTGGTGAATLTANNVLLGNGTSAVQFVAPSTNGNVLTSNGTTWTSTAPAVGPASYTRTAFTATGGQTTFTVSYVVGAVQVYVNGALLNSADYTASNGTSVVLASACLSGDIVEFIAISGGTLALTTITVGTTALSGGSTGRVLYDNGGLVGEIAAGTSGNVLTSDGTSWTSATASPTNGYRRNRIINGGMQVDQRNAGASQTFTAAAALAYSVDRWYGYCTGANVTGQRVAGSSINQYRYQFTGAASVTAIGFGQRIEAANSYDLNNGTAIFSVDLANSLLTTVTWTAYYANTADTFGSLASPTRTQISTGTFTVTSTVTRYTASISVPAAATTGIEIVFTVGAQTSGTWTIGAVQIEAGSLATPFERLSIGETLALCQRYYQTGVTVIYGPSSQVTGQGVQWVSFQAAMRAGPTVSLSSFTYGNGSAGSVFNPTVVGFNPSFTISGLNSYMISTFAASAEL
jgi:hypothetical protein